MQISCNIYSGESRFYTSGSFFNFCKLEDSHSTWLSKESKVCEKIFDFLLKLIHLARFQLEDVSMFIDKHLEYPGILEQNMRVFFLC